MVMAPPYAGEYRWAILFIIEIQTADGTCAVHEVKDEIRVLGRSKTSADIMLEDKKVSDSMWNSIWMEPFISEI